MNDLKFLDLHGDRVAYRDDGDGEVLLLIHGMAGSSDSWRSVLPQLSKKFRVIAPDLLGHGESAKPRSDYSLGALAVFLRDFLGDICRSSPPNSASARPPSSATRSAEVSPCSSSTSTPTTSSGWS